MKKRVLSLFGIIVLAFGLVACSGENTSDIDISEDVEFACDLLTYGTIDRITQKYPEVEINDDGVVLIEADFADIKGHYEICAFSDEGSNPDNEIDYIIFRNEEEFDFNSLSKSISNCLGKHIEKDSGYLYRWENDEYGLDFALYAEQGAWIYPLFDWEEKISEKCESGEHLFTEWSDWDIDYDDAKNVKENICLDCEEVVETEEEDVKTFVGDSCFKIYPYAFAKRFDEQSARLNGIEYYSEEESNENKGFYDEENTVFYRIKDVNANYSDVGIYSFDNVNGNQVAKMNTFTENIISCINILVEDSYDVSAVVYSTILAIDPGIDYSEAADVGQDIVDGIALAGGELEIDEFPGLDYNGINYLLYKDHKYHYLIVKPIEGWKLEESGSKEVENASKEEGAGANYVASSGEYDTYELAGLKCSFPKDWEMHVDDTVIKAYTGEHEKYHSWYLSYKEGCKNIQEYLDEEASESFASEFYDTYKEIVIDGCDEAYTQFEKDEDCSSVDYYVTYNGKVYQLQYFAYNEVYSEDEAKEFLSKVEFK